MNEDYLWEKSGAPDPEIQQLEEILGTLRSQPKPLQLAEHSSATRGRNYLALLAIAATVAVALLAAGFWLRVKSYDLSIAPVAMDTTPPSTPKIGFLSVVQPASPKRHHAIRAAKHDNQEAVAAKQQLMFALRLASEKLNAAYRRTQTPTQIKNQHRAG